MKKAVFTFIAFFVLSLSFCATAQDVSREEVFNDLNKARTDLNNYYLDHPEIQQRAEAKKELARLQNKKKRLEKEEKNFDALNDKDPYKYQRAISETDDSIKLKKAELDDLGEEVSDKGLETLLDERDYQLVNYYILDVLARPCPTNFNEMLRQSKENLQELELEKYKKFRDTYLPLLEKYEYYTVDLYRFMSSTQSKAQQEFFDDPKGATASNANRFEQAIYHTKYGSEIYLPYKKNNALASSDYLDGIINKALNLKDTRLKGADVDDCRLLRDNLINMLIIGDKRNMERLAAQQKQEQENQQRRNNTVASNNGRNQNSNNKDDDFSSDDFSNTPDTGHSTISGASRSEITTDTKRSKEECFKHWEKRTEKTLFDSDRELISKELEETLQSDWENLDDDIIRSEISKQYSNLPYLRSKNSAQKQQEYNPDSGKPIAIDNENKGNKKKDDKKVEQQPRPAVPNAAAVISEYEKEIKAVNVNADYDVLSNEFKSIISKAENDPKIQMSPDKPKMLCNAGDRWAEGIMTYFKNNKGHISPDKMSQIKKDADFLIDKRYLNKRKSQFNDFYMENLR